MAYSQELSDAIVQALATSSLRDICRAPGMPHRATVERWMIEDAEFAARCARARELHADHIVEGHADIEAGVLDGTIRADAARVVISSQQWRASKMNQRRYGDKLAVGGADDMPPIKTATDDQILARIAVLQAKIDAAGKR